MGTLTDVKKDIKNYKERLVRKAKHNGLWENFGDEEVRVLEDEYHLHQFSDDNVWKTIREFAQWCYNCDINELEKY